VELNQSLLAEIGERRRAEEALEKAATTDYLTGLLNRRAMVQLLTIERERMRRRTAPFSIALIDVDHFKQINDQHGHEVGDQTLIFLANELRQLVRAQDAIARWGGEELLIFLPETPAAGAGLVAEKVRARFASAKVVVAGHEIALTMSVGVASQAADQAIDETIGRADAALYRAKLSGRNLVVNAD
jgi:diguanylate cyclase (GGDEF)-like protein